MLGKGQDLKAICDEIYSNNFEPYLKGRRDLFTGLLGAYLSRGHVLLEGPPGTAKTLIAKLFAKTFSKTFKRIQFTSDLTPAQVIGSHQYNPAKGEYKFVTGPLFADIVLADEINRAPPRTQSAFLEAMEERQLTVEGHTIELGDNFFVVATQNPIDYEGTHQLPEVQLDRFLFSFSLKPAPLDEEVEIVNKHLLGKLPPPMNDLKTVEINFMEMHGMLTAITVEIPLVDYAVRLVRGTRENPTFKRGASLRAMLAIVKGSQMQAALEGRKHVVAEDIRAMAMPSLRHRIELSEEAKTEFSSIEAALTAMFDTIEMPKSAAAA